MHPRDSSAAQAAASTVVKQSALPLGSDANSKTQCGQAMPSEPVRSKTQGEGTELTDTASMRFRTTPISRRECVLPALPSALVPGRLTRSHTIVKDTIGTQSAQDPAQKSVPPSMTTNLEIVQQVNKQNAELRRAPESITLNFGKLEMTSPTHEAAKPRFENSLRVMSRENDGLARQRESLVRERDNLVKQQHKLASECNWWSKKCHDLNLRCTTLTGDNQAMRKELDSNKETIQQMALQNEELRGRIHEQEVSVTKAQNAAMSMLSHSLSAPLPDDLIRSRFSELFERVTDWARANSATPQEAIFANPNNISKWQRDGLLKQIERADFEPDFSFNFHDNTAVDTLLNAALARQLCRDFLEHPFWFAERVNFGPAENSDQNETLDVSDMLERMSDKIKKYHKGQEVNFHNWRASTVQALAGSEEARKEIFAAYRHYLEGDLLPQYRELIQSPVSNLHRAGLLTIVESFGSFAIELWTQKMRVECHFLDSFEKKTWHQGSQYMETARAVGIDDQDMKLDGRPIPVVVQPLIFGYGTHDGKEYEKRKVWSKAVVWVRKDKEPITASANDTMQAIRFLHFFGLG